MEHWRVPTIWGSETAFIIGGGHSLRSFDEWDRLLGKNVIGLNDCFLYHPDLLRFAAFGDRPWFNHNRDALHSWSMPEAREVVTCWKGAEGYPDWVQTLDRQSMGLSSTAERCAWNGNTGSVGINLAYLLGATTIVLLGYDMKLDRRTRDPNWYEQKRRRATEDTLRTFMQNLGGMAKALASQKIRVVNAELTKGASALDYFEKMPMESALCL